MRLKSSDEHDSPQPKLRATLNAFGVAVLLFVSGLTALFAEETNTLPTTITAEGAQQEKERPRKEFAESLLKASGGFTFRNVSVKPDELLHMILVKGDIVNTTAKDWDVAKFEWNFYDASGKKIECYGNDFTVASIKRGEAKPIKDGFGQYVFFSAEALKLLKGCRVQLDFVGGKYTAYYRFAMTKPKESKELVFSDDEIAVNFKISSRQLAFAISNKTGQPIRIDWNQISYVDALGKAHKAIHKGIKYTDKANPQPVTIVPPGAFVEDAIIPVDSVHFSGGHGYVPDEWVVDPFFPAGQDAKAYEGATLNVFMPLEINGNVTNYNFAFKITNVEF